MTRFFMTAIALAGTLAMLGPSAIAKSPTPIPRIGVLLTGGPGTHTSFVNWLREGMRARGYREGLDYVLEPRFARGNKPRVSELAQKLVHEKVDVIVPIGLIAALEAAKATRTIPIVVGTTSRILGTGLVQSLAKPGGNVTGMTSFGLEIAAKRLEILNETLPQLSRVALVYESLSTIPPLAARSVREAGRERGIDVRNFAFKTSKEISPAFSEMKEAQTDALIVLIGRFTSVHRKRLINLALEWQIPSMCWMPAMVKSGCLMSYGNARADLLHRAAGFVDRILKGAKPADLPIEQPTKFYLTLNLKTARALGITFPRSVLLRADKVIE